MFLLSDTIPSTEMTAESSLFVCKLSLVLSVKPQLNILWYHIKSMHMHQLSRRV